MIQTGMRGKLRSFLMNTSEGFYVPCVIQLCNGDFFIISAAEGFAVIHEAKTGLSEQCCGIPTSMLILMFAATGRG